MSSGVNLHHMNNFKELEMWVFLPLEVELKYKILQLVHMLIFPT